MAQPRVLVLRAPGTNCDIESAHAFELAGAAPTRWHVNRILENPALLDEFQILCLPGGFSYGDDIAAGRILGNQIRNHLAEPLARFKSADKLILGICNGFQILIRSGLLLDDDPVHGPPATLAHNVSGKFEDRWVWLKTAGQKSVFFQGVEELELPVAHAEGQFVCRDAATLAALESRGQLVLRYGRASDNGAVEYPANPNGSQAAVAGVCDATGRVLGLMPHPERHIDFTQHPAWTRREKREIGDGFIVFQNAVRYFR